MASRYERYLIDTNIVRFFFDGNPIVKSYWERVPAGNLYISIISIGEIFCGRVHAALSHKRDEVRVREQYSGLFHHYTEDFNGLKVCDYTPEALALMPGLDQNVKISDRRIAAIALANNFKVVTHDLKDFPKLMPAERLVDWTIDPSLE